MGTGKQPISTAAAEPAGKVVQVELAPGRVLAKVELGQVAVLEQELAIAQVVERELPTAPVVALELVIGPAVVPELVIGQVKAELELVRVVAELEHVLGEAELELVRAAVPLRTKSVITPHHRGLVPLLGAEEDLAAAEVETTREPAAAEAVIAWEVAE